MSGIVLPSGAKAPPEEVPGTVCPFMSGVQLAPDAMGGIQGVATNRPCIKACVFYDVDYLSGCRLTRTKLAKLKSS